MLRPANNILLGQVTDKTAVNDRVDLLALTLGVCLVAIAVVIVWGRLRKHKKREQD